MKLRNSHPTIWLVRHGESTWNVAGLVQGQADGPVLTSEGRSQAEAVADRVRSLPIRTIVSSDLTRATETASIVADRLGRRWVKDAALRERNFGAAEGSPFDALPVDWSGIEGGRVVDAEARPPGGESIQDLNQRVSDFFGGLARQDLTGDVLVVTHGGVIRTALARCDDVPVERMPWVDVPNCGLWSVGLLELCPLVLL
jgi:2,3-bisphosphoglycerate-dependent phosphoglycerate mutase